MVDDVETTTARVRKSLGHRGSCQVLLVQADGVQEVWIVDQLLWDRQEGLVSPSVYRQDWLARVVLVRLTEADYLHLVELGVVHEGLRQKACPAPWYPHPIS